jgi:FlaA1/EpsC-like NDP-sugar epimerase
MDEIVVNLRSIRLTKEVILRIVADALMINFSFLTALTARFLYFVVFEQMPVGFDYHRVFWSYVTSYRNTAWLLTLICLMVFFASGFYTYGRVYRGRYKALVVVQAVSLSYLLFAFLSYFLGGALGLPRGAWVLSWILSMGMLVAARMWALLWANVVRVEGRRFEQSVSHRRCGLHRFSAVPTIAEPGLLGPGAGRAAVWP